MAKLLAAACFLPLFPLSVVFNALLARLPTPGLRGLMLLLWPGAGVVLLKELASPIPEFVAPWALATSALYALRLITVRDLELWTGLFATSAYALAWLAPLRDEPLRLGAFVAGFALPAAGLMLTAGAIGHRLGAAYAGLPATLGGTPRLALLLTLLLLAAVATPPAPGFFGLMGVLGALTLPGALVVLLVWLVWCWAAVRLLAGFLAAGEDTPVPADVTAATLGVGLCLLALFTGVGLSWAQGR